MRHVAFGLVLVLCAGAVPAWETAVTPTHTDVVRDGAIWLRTEHAPFDPADRESTYKVYTQVYDFAGAAPITKGTGGKYPHHRGMFIGWNDTYVDGKEYDTWHMRDCTQEYAGAVENAAPGSASFRVDWKDNDGKTFIEETRTVAASEADGVRLFDFTSTVTAIGAPIQFRGDLQHAGMQIRMASEVSDHEDTTSFILPAGAVEEDDDAVPGAWWACASVEVGGKRYWVLHMTGPDLTEAPVYSIRQYARFGAFWEPDVPAGTPTTWRFRVAVSEKELTQADCQAFFDAYRAAVK